MWNEQCKGKILTVNATGTFLCTFWQTRSYSAFTLPVIPSYSGLRFLMSMKAIAYGLNDYPHSLEEACVLYLVSCFSRGFRPTAVFSYLSVFVPVPSSNGKWGCSQCSVAYKKGMRREDMQLRYTWHLKYKSLYLQEILFLGMSRCVCWNASLLCFTLLPQTHPCRHKHTALTWVPQH